MPNSGDNKIWRDIDKAIRHAVIDEERRRFVIYTNGVGGKMVKKYLQDVFSLSPEYTIDNKVYDGKEILNLEQARRRNNSDVCFLICSFHEDYYDEIRRKIYGIFPKEQILDVFPKTSNYEHMRPVGEICEILHYIDSYLTDIKEVEWNGVME